VAAEVAGPLELLLRQALVRQRLEVTDVVGGDAQSLAHAAAELVMAHEEVPDHALLDAAGGLADVADEVLDEVVLLPLLHELEPLARLLVVVRALQLGAREPAAQLGTDLLLPGMDGRLAQPAV